MQIMRGTILANKRPIDGDETGMRYKHYIPQSELDKERRRLEAETAKIEARRAQSTTMAPIVEQSRQGVPTSSPMRTATAGGDIAAALEALATRQEQFEQDLRQEREDTRALIRSVEQQVDMLKTMVTAFLAK